MTSAVPVPWRKHPLKTDVLVVGGGAAGIRAALAAAGTGVSVLLVSDPAPAGGGSTFQNVSGGWGIQALIEEERTEPALEAFHEDILRVGLGQADSVLARILVEESGPRVLDLLDMGVRFRAQAGRFLRVRGCFSKAERALLTQSMDNVRDAFLSAVRRSPVKTITGTAVQLLAADGRCWGAWIIEPPERLLCVVSPVTILATGGGAGMFPISLAPPGLTGTGCALAREAGAALRNMEFIQFMLALEREGAVRFLPLADLRHRGRLRFEQGEDLLDRALPESRDRASVIAARTVHHPFSSRDVSRLVDLAVAEETVRDRTVLWGGPEEDGGPWHVVHAAHAFNGGVRIDAHAASTLPGLFAAGETAAGPHGADRIGGCMMTATQVFGERAGRFGAEEARRASRRPDRFDEPNLLARWSPRPLPAGSLSELRARMQSCLEDGIGVLRDAAGLRRCLDRTRTLRREANQMTWRTLEQGGRLHRLACALSVGEAVAEAALARPGSLGGHMRTDSPPDPS